MQTSADNAELRVSPGQETCADTRGSYVQQSVFRTRNKTMRCVTERLAILATRFLAEYVRTRHVHSMCRREYKSALVATRSCE